MNGKTAKNSKASNESSGLSCSCCRIWSEKAVLRYVPYFHEYLCAHCYIWAAHALSMDAYSWVYFTPMNTETRNEKTGFAAAIVFS